MSPVDHNKTLVLLYSFLSLTFILPLVGSPWIVAKSVRNSEQIPIAMVVGFALLVLALLFMATALALYRRKPYARALALVLRCWCYLYVGGWGLYLAVHAHGGWQKAV
jgi:hypothetical protein